MHLQHMERRPGQQHGFTVVEILVAMAMVGIVMAAIYSTYKSQQDSYVAQEQVAEMQQNLRAALYMITRDLRMVGYDPTGSDLFGFAAELPSPNDGLGAITDTTVPLFSSIAFTMDLNNPNGVVDDVDDEQIAYRLNGTTLEKFSATDDDWYAVAENIDALDFVFLDQSGAVIGAPATNLENIRSVEITIVARTGRADEEFAGTPAFDNQQGTEILAAQSDNIRRRRLTTTILCRNMGI